MHYSYASVKPSQSHYPFDEFDRIRKWGPRFPDTRARRPVAPSAKMIPGQFFIFTASTRRSRATDEKSLPAFDPADSISPTVATGRRMHFWINIKRGWHLHQDRFWTAP